MTPGAVVDGILCISFADLVKWRYDPIRVIDCKGLNSIRMYVIPTRIRNYITLTISKASL